MCVWWTLLTRMLRPSLAIKEKKFRKKNKAFIDTHPNETIEPLLELLFAMVGETAAVDHATRPPFSAVVARLRLARLRLPQAQHKRK